MVGRNERSCHVLAEQIKRRGEQNEILHKKRNSFGHGREAARRWSPSARDERNNGEGGDKGKTCTERSENSQFLVPKAQEQQSTKQPFGHSEEVSGSPNTENRIHPEKQRAVPDVRKQCLRFIFEPLLIAEEKENDDQRCADQVVIKVVFENTYLN